MWGRILGFLNFSTSLDDIRCLFNNILSIFCVQSRQGILFQAFVWVLRKKKSIKKKKIKTGLARDISTRYNIFS